MSSFLYAIGNRICLVSVGLLFLLAVRQIENEYKKVFKFIAFMIIAIACFFIIQIMIPKRMLIDAFGIRDLHPAFYFVAMGLLSVSSGFILTLFQKALIATERKLKENIRLLIGYIVKKSKKEDENEMWNVLEKVANNE